MAYSNGKREFIVTGRLLSSSRDIVSGDKEHEYMDKTKPKLDKYGAEIFKVFLRIGFPKSQDMWTDKNSIGPWWEAAQGEAHEFFNGQIPETLWKDSMVDLDVATDKNNVPLANRPGHAGHMAIDLNTVFSLNWTKWDQQQGRRVEILDPNKEVKRGDYVQVAGYVQARDGLDEHGKPMRNSFPKVSNVVLHATLVGYGEPIRTGRDAEQIFGTEAPPIPQGASLTPVGPGGSVGGPPQGAPPMGAPVSQGGTTTTAGPPGGHTVQAAPMGPGPATSAPPQGNPPPSGGPPALNTNEGMPF